MTQKCRLDGAYRRPFLRWPTMERYIWINLLHKWQRRTSRSSLAGRPPAGACPSLPAESSWTKRRKFYGKSWALWYVGWVLVGIIVMLFLLIITGKFCRLGLVVSGGLPKFWHAPIAFIFHIRHMIIQMLLLSLSGVYPYHYRVDLTRSKVELTKGYFYHGCWERVLTLVYFCILYQRNYQATYCCFKSPQTNWWLNGSRIY